MPYYAYILRSEKNGKNYFGSVEVIEARLLRHNAGKVKSTKAYKPFILIYKEQFPTRIDARKKEKYLKSGVGKEFLKAIKVNAAMAKLVDALL